MFGYDEQSWGFRWGFAFLETDTRLNYDERLEVLVEATKMYICNEKERRVKGKNYEGIITTDGRYNLMGDFGGRQYKAKIEIGDKTANLSFLVKEHINPTLN